MMEDVGLYDDFATLWDTQCFPVALLLLQSHQLVVPIALV